MSFPPNDEERFRDAAAPRLAIVCEPFPKADALGYVDCATPWLVALRDSVCLRIVDIGTPKRVPDRDCALNTNRGAALWITH
jgi:hypothetical protein